MTFVRSATLAVTLIALAAASAQAQDKPSVGKYVADGYEIIHVEGGGGQFASFILKKDKVLVHCNVALQSGDTTSCRTIK